MFGSTTSANLIAKAIHDADKTCRQNLHQGIIVDEPDYVSNFTREVRQNANNQGYNCFTHAQALPKPIEQKLGCDAILLFKVTDNEGIDTYKVGLFEAKWPRVIKNPNQAWDSLQGNVSHFSSQIHRQHPYRKQAVIWEMFFLEALPGQAYLNFDIDGSSCVRHDPAHSHAQNVNPTWSNSDLNSVFATDCENIQHIIQDIIMCQEGSPLNGDGNGTVILNSDENDEDSVDFNFPVVSIPVPISTVDEVSLADRVAFFMLEHGLSTYLYLDMNRKDQEPEPDDIAWKMHEMLSQTVYGGAADYPQKKDKSYQYGTNQEYLKQF